MLATFEATLAAVQAWHCCTQFCRLHSNPSGCKIRVVVQAISLVLVHLCANKKQLTNGQSALQYFSSSLSWKNNIRGHGGLEDLENCIDHNSSSCSNMCTVKRGSMTIEGIKASACCLFCVTSSLSTTFDVCLQANCRDILQLLFRIAFTPQHMWLLIAFL